jgi:DNA-binding LytR/AlgR family response regulator
VKIRIELVDNLEEEEVLIRCGQVDDRIDKIHQFILEQSFSEVKIVFYKENQEFHFPLNDVLFFETEGEHVYAHTITDAYQIKYRLYELEEILPKCFVRVAKSTIINIVQVYSVTRNLSSSSLIQFINSHKQVYVSRYYYKQMRQCLNERSNYEK